MSDEPEVEINPNTSLADLIDEGEETKNEEVISEKENDPQDEPGTLETPEEDTGEEKAEATEETEVEEPAPANDTEADDFAAMEETDLLDTVEPEQPEIDKSDDKEKKGRIIVIDRNSLKALKRSRGFMIRQTE